MKPQGAIFTVPDSIEISQGFAPLFALIDSLDAGAASATRLTALSRLRKLHVDGSGFLEHHAEELRNLYRYALEHHAAPEELEAAAGILSEKERAAAETLVPGIDQLQRKLAARSEILDPELRNAFQANIDIAIQWLAVYRSTREALLKLASDRQGLKDQVLRARPVPGEIDYAALTREIIARFPKILAALAK
jgi:hypothetical protein